MDERKSYGQFCGLARALDHVGDRWTLLIVRELLLGPKSFRRLQANLPGMGPSLLTTRIAALIADGIVERNEAPARSKAVVYKLTAEGRGLEASVIELIRWGARWMMTGPSTDHVDPSWAPLALRALLEGSRCAPGCVHLDVDGVKVTVRARRGRREVLAGHHGDADASVGGPLPQLLAVASGAVPLSKAGAAVSGDRNQAMAMLCPAAGHARVQTAPEV